MQRMSVLLPLPLGPHTTTTSPALTFRFMLLRTWSEPNHLFTSRNSITVRGYISLSKIAKCRTAYYMNKDILQQIATRSCIDIARLNGSVLSAATKFFIRCGRFRNKIGGGSIRRGYLSRATRRGRVGKNQS